MLDPNFGLGAGLGIPLLQQDWLGRGDLALGVVIFVVSWQYIPFHSLIYQSGVRQIPRSMYEAAELDGASPLARFRFLTLPLLRRIIFFAVVVSTIWAFQVFDTAIVLTRGGRHAPPPPWRPRQRRRNGLSCEDDALRNGWVRPDARLD